jgi:Protein of unknown function (DUF3311)
LSVRIVILYVNTAHPHPANKLSRRFPGNISKNFLFVFDTLEFVCCLSAHFISQYVQSELTGGGMDSNFQGERSRPRYWYRWMLVIPFIWQAALAPAVNDIAARPFGLPFPMFWQMAGIVLASIVIGLVFFMDRRAGLEDEEASFLERTSASMGDGQ